MAVWHFDSFRFDEADGRLSRGESVESVHLRPQVAHLLQLLLEHHGEVVEREFLHQAIWGPNTVVDFEAGLAALVRELRRTLEQLGADEQLLETVPRRGLRFNARALRADAESTPSRARMDRSPRFRRWRIAALVLLAVAIAAWWWIVRPLINDESSYSLAIVPLQVVGKPAPEAGELGLLMADNLLAELWTASLDDLDLIGRTSMAAYAGRDDVLEAVAGDLGVDLVLEGSAEFRPGRWRIVLRLLAVPPGEVVWSRTLSDNGAEPGAAEVAEAMVDELESAWPGVRARLAEIGN